MVQISFSFPSLLKDKGIYLSPSEIAASNSELVKLFSPKASVFFLVPKILLSKCSKVLESMISNLERKGKKLVVSLSSYSRATLSYIYKMLCFVDFTIDGRDDEVLREMLTLLQFGRRFEIQYFSEVIDAAVSEVFKDFQDSKELWLLWELREQLPDSRLTMSLTRSLHRNIRTIFQTVTQPLMKTISVARLAGLLNSPHCPKEEGCIFAIKWAITYLQLSASATGKRKIAGKASTAQLLHAFGLFPTSTLFSTTTTPAFTWLFLRLTDLISELSFGMTVGEEEEEGLSSSISVKAISSQLKPWWRLLVFHLQQEKYLSSDLDKGLAPLQFCAQLITIKEFLTETLFPKLAEVEEHIPALKAEEEEETISISPGHFALPAKESPLWPEFGSSTPRPPPLFGNPLHKISVTIPSSGTQHTERTVTITPPGPTKPTTTTKAAKRSRVDTDPQRTEGKSKRQRAHQADARNTTPDHWNPLALENTLIVRSRPKANEPLQQHANLKPGDILTAMPKKGVKGEYAPFGKLGVIHLYRFRFVDGVYPSDHTRTTRALPTGAQVICRYAYRPANYMLMYFRKRERDFDDCLCEKPAHNQFVRLSTYETLAPKKVFKGMKMQVNFMRTLRILLLYSSAQGGQRVVNAFCFDFMTQNPCSQLFNITPQKFVGKTVMCLQPVKNLDGHLRFQPGHVLTVLGQEGAFPSDFCLLVGLDQEKRRECAYAKLPLLPEHPRSPTALLSSCMDEFPVTASSSTFTALAFSLPSV